MHGIDSYFDVSFFNLAVFIISGRSSGLSTEVSLKLNVYRIIITKYWLQATYNFETECR